MKAKTLEEKAEIVAIVKNLRQSGKSLPEALQEAKISHATYYKYKGQAKKHHKAIKIKKPKIELINIHNNPSPEEMTIIIIGKESSISVALDRLVNITRR